MSSDPIISVVMPFYNEGTVITQTVQETVKHLSLCCSQFEILCIDDGSTDLGPEHVARLSTTHPEVQLIRLSRNFGKEAALAAGLELAQGTAVVVMDADMQHPPSLLPTMVAAWREGHHLVEAVKNPTKSVSAHHRFASAFFHRLMGLATDRNLVGDALKAMIPAFRLGLGGPLGDGQQWISWIALDDLVRAIVHCIDTESISGPVLGVSPNPVRQIDFARALGRAVRRPSFMPAPRMALKMMMGEMGQQLLLDGQRCVPQRLQDTGFKWHAVALQETLFQCVRA